MIKYLRKSSQNEKELQFVAKDINPVYKKMLGIVIGHYDRKTSYGYNESDETASIGVKLEPSEVGNEEYMEKEANRFMDWFNVAINEVVIDNYKSELRKKL